jgi:hypothetical protein
LQAVTAATASTVNKGAATLTTAAVEQSPVIGFIGQSDTTLIANESDVSGSSSSSGNTGVQDFNCKDLKNCTVVVSTNSKHFLYCSLCVHLFVMLFRNAAEESTITLYIVQC